MSISSFILKNIKAKIIYTVFKQLYILNISANKNFFYPFRDISYKPYSGKITKIFNLIN